MDAVMATVMNRAAQTFFHTGGVTLLGAGVFESAVLDRAMALCPDLYCADGGANIAPVPPIAVIGDLDSVDRAAAHLRGCVFHSVFEQNSTDFDKSLAAIVADYILCVGFLGGRLDHQWAAFSALIKHPWQRAILLGGGEVCFRAPTAFVMECAEGTPIGLYPLTPARGRSVGLEWAIDGLDLCADGRLGTSNRAIGGRVELTVQSGDILVSLPLACLESVVGGLVVRG